MKNFIICGLIVCAITSIVLFFVMNTHTAASLSVDQTITVLNMTNKTIHVQNIQICTKNGAWHTLTPDEVSTGILPSAREGIRLLKPLTFTEGYVFWYFSGVPQIVYRSELNVLTKEARLRPNLLIR